MKKLLVFGLTGVLALGMAGVASASLIQIQFSGLDLVYDGSAIYDAGVHNSASTGNPTDADQLLTMSFLQDAVPLGTLSSNIFADLYIPGVQNIPVAGGTVYSMNPYTGFGLDLLTSNSNPGWGLALQFTSPVELIYTAGGTMKIQANATTTSISHQALPYGLNIGTPVTISLTANVIDFGQDGGFVTRFTAAGPGEVDAPASTVPEPGTLMLLGMGLLGGGGLLARRRRK